MKQAQCHRAAFIVATLLFATSCGSTAPPTDQYAEQRAACTFDRGAFPVETLGTSVPLGDQI
ncbi:MAG: hypothetical protein WCF10_10280, partial [Polyangiales bacterium]